VVGQLVEAELVVVGAVVVGSKVEASSSRRDARAVASSAASAELEDRGPPLTTRYLNRAWFVFTLITSALQNLISAPGAAIANCLLLSCSFTVK
jgi:hypothetical protein